MEQQELNELMRDSAENARISTQNEFGIELDGSVSSIAKVDDVLLSFLDKYQDNALEDQAVFTLCNIYGAYLGEVFKQTVGGQWRYDTSDPQAPYVLLEYNGRTFAFAGICYERLVNDSTVSVRAYFDQAVSNSTQ
ncbi:hypothetical protein QTP81_08685 [Alteromonas sp. ASW11-36]|uniref:DUF3806 domain-containing protein n=1 Tax=Alteromonas arenosi TaxID=3055817 RepID=A0ABT7SWY5_9ALTE|nr:hypothetical protein [Alteromonas sp. ASW11-36]MDM7860670.1 hypothetical protein [Alteromonas sp. ASW11-36]